MYFFKKKWLVCIIEVATLILLGFFMYHMQMQLSVQHLYNGMEREIEKIGPYLQTIHETEETLTQNYDAVYQAKAEILAYMIQNKIDGSRSQSLLKEYSALLEVENILIIDREGNILLQTAETKAEFSYIRYTQLLAAFEMEDATEAFNVEIDGQSNRYYGAKIDEECMVVLEIPSDELVARIQRNSSWKAVLENINVGINGFAFAVSKKDYTFLYYPDENMIGRDSISAGMDVEQLKEGDNCRISVGRDNLYCVIVETKDAYIICATNEKELEASCRIAVIAIMLVIFSVITIIITYIGFLSQDDVEERRTDGKIGRFIYDRRIVNRSGVISIIGMLCIFFMSLYIQTLFMYSNYSIGCNDRVSDVEKTIEQYENEIVMLQDEYNNVYLNKCRIVAHIVQSAPEQITRSELAKICNALDISYIYVYDENGSVSTTNSPIQEFQISDDQEDQSYVFSGLLRNKEYVIQEARVDDSGDFMQYIGVSLRNDENLAVGFVQIGVQPEELESKYGNLNIYSILDEASVGSEGFAFAVNKADGTYAYYPEGKYIGELASEHGIDENVLTDKFNGSIRINQVNYYGASLETEDYYIYAVVPKSEIRSPQLPMALVSTLAAFLCLGAIILILLTQTGRDKAKANSSVDKNDQMVDVVMPDGNVKKTEAAVSRWDNLTIKWRNRTAEQKVFTLVKAHIFLLDLCVVILFFFGERVFSESSVLYYIVNGNWERGLNIFAVTACIIVICVISVMVEVVQWILRLISRILTAKGETICRLLGNALRYICIIAEIYYCLVQFGVDTEPLVASAGILSLVIGLGAQHIITDFLAGLFIIFEGEFQVGDIVTIGDWRGTVLEIGMRTTKIVKDGNIKILNNSDVSNVINMTKRGSYVECEIGIGYEESLERVEEILKKELPLVKDRIEEIETGPYYTGVSSLGHKSVNLAISAQCAEPDLETAKSKLIRELKLLSDRYELNIQ